MKLLFDSDFIFAFVAEYKARPFFLRKVAEACWRVEHDRMRRGRMLTWRRCRLVAAHDVDVREVDGELLYSAPGLELGLAREFPVCYTPKVPWEHPDATKKLYLWIRKVLRERKIEVWRVCDGTFRRNKVYADTRPVPTTCWVGETFYRRHGRHWRRCDK